MRQETLNYYCRGRGLEVGPGEHPLNLLGRELTYFDMTGGEASIFGRKNLLAGALLVEGEAERLSDYFPEGHFDFLASSHVLEHCRSPIETLDQWSSVVKPGGFLWLALPLKDQCFDRDRPNAELAHIIADMETFEAEPHYREWFSLGPDKLAGEALETRIRQAVIGKENIHFHAWDEKGWVELLCHCWKLGMFTIAEQRRNGHEMIFALKKGG